MSGGEHAKVLATARLVLSVDDNELTSARARGAALLARQALEGALADYWRLHVPGLEEQNMRAQLNCARVYLPDDCYGTLSYTWHGLSHATHHRPYELDPTVGELKELIAGAEILISSHLRTARDQPSQLRDAA